MRKQTRIIWVVANVILVAVLVVVLVVLARAPVEPGPGVATTATAPAELPGPVIRIGLVPERDIFRQRRRYQALADYMAGKLHQRTELVTLATYEAVLNEFAGKDVDAAFLGSLVAVLAMDRLDAQPVVRPQLPDGTSTYHGVIFVRADSPIRRLEQLAGHSIAMVRTTTAGHIFPGCILMRLGLLSGPAKTRIVWVGTHDDVANEVMAGHVDAGAAKNLRLDALLRLHPEWKIRRLATGHDVPSNGVLVRSDEVDTLAPRLSKVLLAMDSDPEARDTLALMGIAKFIPCRAEDYLPVYNMVSCILPAWQQVGVPGQPPVRPAGWPPYQHGGSWQCYDANY